jgi:hypothetical protein
MPATQALNSYTLHALYVGVATRDYNSAALRFLPHAFISRMTEFSSSGHCTIFDVHHSFGLNQVAFGFLTLRVSG